MPLGPDTEQSSFWRGIYSPRNQSQILPPRPMNPGSAPAGGSGTAAEPVPRPPPTRVAGSNRRAFPWDRRCGARPQSAGLEGRPLEPALSLASFHPELRLVLRFLFGFFQSVRAHKSQAGSIKTVEGQEGCFIPRTGFLDVRSHWPRAG